MTRRTAVDSDFLAAMAASSHARVAAARDEVDDAALLACALATPPPPRLHLSKQGFDLIAEVKLRSPALGALRGKDEDVAGRVAQYAEARAAGAGGVLAILRMIPPEATAALLDMAARLGLFVLLEAFDEADLALAEGFLRSHLARALAADAPLLVGINCRDLVTLQVVPGRLEQLASHLPRNAPRVAESGVETVADVARLAKAGYTMALVGGALMKSADPAVTVRDFLAAGRA